MSRIKDYLAEVEDIDDLKPIKMDTAMAEAHADYEHRKQIIIDKLEMLISDTPYKIYEDTLKEAVEFIKEKEV